MGCVESSGTSQPSGAGSAEDIDGGNGRVRFNKATGEIGIEEPRDKPEGDFFEVEEAGEGEQFMAVKPWIGAIKEPANHPPPDATPPDARYALEYVYGYRCEDSRMNLYFNPSGEAVYMTAALGVILNMKNNTQKFFGGGLVDNKAKNVSDDTHAHTDDITALTISPDRQWVASGQVGSAPAVFIWNS